MVIVPCQSEASELATHNANSKGTAPNKYYLIDIQPAICENVPSGIPVFFLENEVQSPKKIWAMLLSLASRGMGESHDRNRKEAVQAGIARCL